MSKPAAEWHDLPDPRESLTPGGARCCVQLQTWSWQHIATKHILPGDEPWGEWLNLAVDNAAVLERSSKEIFAILGNEIRYCLEKPLAILSGKCQDDVPMAVTTWELVLPGGALLIIRSGPRRHPHVITCFFPRAVLRERKPHLRWRRLVGKLVQRHAEFDTDSGSVIAPGGGVRFVTAQSWGFHPELCGCPWRGTLTDSPGYHATAPQPKRKLKPRQEVVEECT